MSEKEKFSEEMIGLGSKYAEAQQNLDIASGMLKESMETGKDAREAAELLKEAEAQLASAQSEFADKVNTPKIESAKAIPVSILPQDLQKQISSMIEQYAFTAADKAHMQLVAERAYLARKDEETDERIAELLRIAFAKIKNIDRRVIKAGWTSHHRKNSRTPTRH